MHTVLVAGTGKIGRLIACLLVGSGDYDVHLVDLSFSGPEVHKLKERWPELKTAMLDVTNTSLLMAYLKKHHIEGVVSSLPYFLNPSVAKAARGARVHYFDLTEDISVTEQVRKEAHGSKTVFVPQCGLAPGFVSIAANSLLKEFEECVSAKLRVGALPQHSSNALHYSLTWSTDGLVNEYSNLCNALESGSPVLLKPLDGLEMIQIDGALYEAFNTSGGLGSLASLWLGRVRTLNYKTMRYPGHCKKMRFLLEDLKLGERRELIKSVLEQALPKTAQDIVIIYISVEGIRDGEYLEKNYVKKIYPRTIYGLEWSAIQISTASGLLAVLDIVFSNKEKYQGLILQETFALEDILKNRFGKYFAGE